MNDWNVYLILAGRGYGKTHRGSQMILDLIHEQERLGNDKLCIGLIGETLFDVKTIMVSGISGIINKLNDSYKLRTKSLHYKNHVFYFFGGNNYDKLRGYNFHIVWIDELCKFKSVQKLLNQVWLCLRLGISKLIITTTPRNMAPLYDLMKRNDIHIETGKSQDNGNNLSENFFKNINNLQDPNFYSQEINGEINSNFNESNIEILDIYDKSGFFILGIDPAIKSGLTGIILVQYFQDKKIVVEDWSTYDHYDLWIHKLIHNLKDINYKIVVEVNQGGNLWKRLLEPLQRTIITVFSQTTKQQRQQFVQHLYKKSIICHQRPFPHLNKELMGEPQDRLDALFFTLENQYKPFKYYLL
jgi:phage terminase large subunit-like protein